MRRTAHLPLHCGWRQPHPITREHSFSSLALAGSGPVIVGLRESFTEPPTLVSIIPRTGAATKSSDFNDAALAKHSGTIRERDLQGANGEPASRCGSTIRRISRRSQMATVLAAARWTAQRAINDIYQWRWNAQVFANWGYVTAWHNFHGSSGFGQAFTDSITKEWAELPYQDTIKAAEWFAAKPWIDRERMGAGGGSFGGYLASLLLGKPHPFKTLIAHAAVYNSYTQYATDDGAIEKASRRILGRLRKLQSQFTASECGELQDTDARHPRANRTSRSRESRHRAIQHPAESRRTEQARAVSRTKITGYCSRRTRCSGTRPRQVARAIREAGARHRRVCAEE